MSSPTSPKQPQPERLKDWYPYYAGFTSEFVESALDRHFTGAERLLDPWNGSGTTTAAGASKGISTTGLDINPALTIIAKARLTPTDIVDSLQPIGTEILRAARLSSSKAATDDPLLQWLRRPTVDNIRNIQRAIHTVVVAEDDLLDELARGSAAGTAATPVLAAFFYSALFAVGRDLLAPFKASNPTWLRTPDDHRERLQPGLPKVEQAFIERVDYLSERLTVKSEGVSAFATIKTGTALMVGGTGSYDSCFSSPPYATRIDYVKSSLAELSILGLRSEAIIRLRRRSTGTPVVRGIRRRKRDLKSATANRAIAAVRGHDSHGSASYYAPWLRNYLTDLEISLGSVNRSVARSGKIGLVVQDSYYKAQHIDLQRIVSETMTAFGREAGAREDYPVRHSMVKINPRAQQHLPARENFESLLLFK